MKAATEEVTKTLEKAGQKVSSEGSPICLSQTQLNDMPVLGMLAILHFMDCVSQRVIVNVHYALTL